MPLYQDTTCHRDRNDCEGYGHVCSDDGSSFVCCGAVKPHARTIPQDRFRLCWKNDEVDEMGDYDRRDVADTLSVLARALSIDANMEANGES